jgi:TolA-binding protein
MNSRAPGLWLRTVAAALAVLSVPGVPPLRAAEAPTPPAETATSPLTGGLLFAETQAWQQVHALRSTDGAPAAFLDFLNRCPRSNYCDDALYWLANAYSRLKLYPEAMAAWRKLIDTYPQSTYADDATWSLAAQCVSNRDYAAAIQVYRFFVTAFPGNPNADDSLYSITRYARYLKDKEQGRATSEWAYQALVAKYPSSDLCSSALYQLIQNLYRDQDYKSCVGLCRRFLETQPCSDYADETQYQIVMCYYGAKVYDQALKEIEALKAEFPGSSYIDYVQTYEETMRMAQMRMPKAFDPEEELEYRESQKGKKPRRRQYTRRLYTPQVAEMPGAPQEEEVSAGDLMDAAVSARNARQWERALLFYQLVFDHFRGDTYWDDALYSMAQVYDLAGDKVRAAASYHRFYAEMTGSDLLDDALWSLAQLYKAEGVDHRAYEVYHEIVEQVPFSAYAAPALDALKKHYFDTRNVTGLLGLYQLVLQRLPGHDLWPEAAFQTGCIQMMYREYVKAREAFKVVLDRCPTSDYALQAQFLLAECERRRGEARRARESYRALVERWPTCGLTDDVLARLDQLAKLTTAARNGDSKEDAAPEGNAKQEGGVTAAPAERQTPPPDSPAEPPKPKPAEVRTPKAPPQAIKQGAAPTGEPPAPDPNAKLEEEPEGKAPPALGPEEWKDCKTSILEQFPDGLKGLADPTAPNSRNPLHVVFSTRKATPLALNIGWCSAGAGTFAVNLFLNGRVLGTVWPDTKQPMIVEIPRWMVRRGRNHLALYAPMDSGQWDYFAILGDGLASAETEALRKETEERKTEAATQPQQPLSEEQLLKAWQNALQDPFSDLWAGRRLTVGKKDSRYLEFSQTTPGKFVEWWVDLDNSRYGATPNTTFEAMIDSLTKEPDKADEWLARARAAFADGKYADAAPLYAGLASVKSLPADLQKASREMVRIAQELVKRPTYDAITTEHFCLLAPLETTVLLRQYDVPQLWEAAYTVLAEWAGDVPYGGDRLVVVYDPDFSSYQGGNPIRLGTRYAQDPPQWDPLFTCLAQAFFYTPAVYAAVGRNYYLAYALSTFASWRLPEVLLPALLPDTYAPGIAAQKTKYLADCDLYVGQGADIKRLNTNVATGLLLKLAAQTKPKPEASAGTAWPGWGEFCKLAAKEAPALAKLTDPDQAWAAFGYFAGRAFGDGSGEILERCGIPQTEAAQAAVSKALEDAEAPAAPDPKA